MKRRSFISRLGLLFILPFIGLTKSKEVFEVKEITTNWKLIEWNHIVEGQTFTRLPSNYNPDHYFVKYKEYGWNSVHKGIPSKCKYHFDPEKAAWGNNRFKVWALV